MHSHGVSRHQYCYIGGFVSATRSRSRIALRLKKEGVRRTRLVGDPARRECLWTEILSEQHVIGKKRGLYSLTSCLFCSMRYVNSEEDHEPLHWDRPRLPNSVSYLTD